MTSFAKTTIRKWLSHELQDRGYRQGFTYFVSLDRQNWYRFSRLPVLSPGDCVRVSVSITRGRYEVDQFSITLPDRIKLEPTKRKAKDMYRDYQRSKVYRVERMMKHAFEYQENRMSQSEIEALVETVAKDYNIVAPKVVITPARKVTSCSVGYLCEIRLAKGWGQDKKVVLHEMAHQIVFQSDIITTSHGGIFVSIMIDLYCKYLGWSMLTMKDLLKEHKVDCSKFLTNVLT